jgi:hypothetical protein
MNSDERLLLRTRLLASAAPLQLHLDARRAQND